MRTVYKYDLPMPQPSGELPVVAVGMPRGAQVLSVGVQHDEPRVWALVDPRERMDTQRLLVVGTGWDLGPEFPWEGWVHVGTFQLARGKLVFHAFREVVAQVCQKVVTIGSGGYREVCGKPALHDGYCR